MKNFLRSVRELCGFQEIEEKFNSSGKNLTIGGISGTLSELTVVDYFNALNVPCAYIVPTSSRVEEVLNNLNSLCDRHSIAFLPPTQLHPFDSSPLATGPQNERIDALRRLNSGDPIILVTQPESLIEKCPDNEWIKKHTILIQVGDDTPRDIFIMELTGAGYKRESVVDSQGQFAVRGAILDIFPFGFEFPLRIEYDFDEITSLRYFDPENQRSKEKLERMSLLIGDDRDIDTAGFFSLLPENAIIYWDGIEEIDERIDSFHDRAKKAYSNGYTKSGLKPSELYLDLDEIRKRAAKFGQITRKLLGRGGQIDVDLKSRPPDTFTPEMGTIQDNIKRYVDKDYNIWITTDTTGEKERLRELLFDYDLEQVNLVTPGLTTGFVCPDVGLAVLTSHELFHRRRLRSRHTRFRRKVVKFDRSSLQKGDLVVHAEYGIGRYEGLQMVKVKGQPHESLRIRYAEDVILYIRIENFNLIEKYTGMESAHPRLTKIGTKEWEKTKKKTRKAIQDIADELVKLYAKRKVLPGYSFSQDTVWQQEMEDSFEFDDTPDQVTSTAELKDDLQSPNPMDRLLCGDVGFGKTEVAIRAAFKVVQDSYQVAVLVPTTILAQQHYETFRERLATFPVKIDMLSRFKSKAEQKEIVSNIKEGKIDIVIGTHRLVSKDVEFKNLGLVIIDEEHRFGVKHKERLKQLRANVDVLTMTATPIPRTMHMALMGARDTSQINTPPVDRLPIQTEIHAWSEQLIRSAILREIDRHGQVFFLHNRVESIYSVKGMLDRIVPGIRIGVAHGQMKEKDLEKIMSEFMRGYYDVLVSTMIIESGLDIPNANTLIVNRADRLGLAQLYQLRGRIGRSSRQAYAYLLTPPKMTMTPNARKRLQTLTELTDLGSGMKVAMRDLEIRGAGNLLGTQQSGFINSVGFDLYTKMLEESVRKARSENLDLPPEPTPEKSVIETKIDFNQSALIPANYIDDSDIRYFFYKKLAQSNDLDTISNLESELRDRFGALPQQTRNLITVSRLKVLCGRLGFTRLGIKKKYMTASLNLPADPTESQRILGKIVAKAAPEEIEFKMKTPVEIIYRFKYDNPLDETYRFLRHTTREGILQD